MAYGMVLTATAFAVASIVQFKVDTANIGVPIDNISAVPEQKSTHWEHSCIGDLDGSYNVTSISDCIRNPELCADCELCVHSCTSILWQIPMYFILTCGEVMVSITGL